MRAPIAVLTGADGAFTGVGDGLRALGVDVRRAPLLGFAPPDQWDTFDAALDRALADPPRYAAIVVTSPRGAGALAERLRVRDAAAALVVPVWVPGEGTARPLDGAATTLRMPDAARLGAVGAAAAVAEAMLAAGVRGPVLYVCGDQRRDELPLRLAEAGVEVDEAVAYRTVLASAAAARAVARHADILIVTSPSVAELLAEVVPVDDRPLLLAAGPTSAAAAAAAGWAPRVTSAAPTAAGITDAVRTLLAARPSSAADA